MKTWLLQRRATLILTALVVTGYWVVPPAVVSTAPWWFRPTLSPFASANWIHLVSNLLCLFLLGSTIERLISSRFLLVSFCSSTMFGELVSQYFWRDSLSVGCSAATYAFLAVFLYLLWWNKEASRPLSVQRRSLQTFILIYVCVLGMQPHRQAGLQVDHVQHITGLLCGIACCSLIRKRQGRLTSILEGNPFPPTQAPREAISTTATRQPLMDEPRPVASRPTESDQ